MVQSVRLDAPSGRTYDAAVQWQHGDDGASLLAELPGSVVQDLHDAELFHLQPTARPRDLALDPAVPLLVLLRPDPSLLAPDDAPPGEGWFAADPRRRSTQSWYVARLQQPTAVPPRDGRTLWAYLDPPSEHLDAEAAVRGAAAFLHAEFPDLPGTGQVLDALVAGLLGGTADGAQVLDALEALLADLDVDVTRIDDGDAVAFHTEGSQGSWLTVAEVQDGVLAVYAVPPLEVPPELRGEAALAVVRFNAARRFGNLDVELDTGKLAYRTPALLTEVPSAAALHALLEASRTGMDEAWPVLSPVSRPVDG